MFPVLLGQLWRRACHGRNDVLVNICSILNCSVRSGLLSFRLLQEQHAVFLMSSPGCQSEDPLHAASLAQTSPSHPPPMADFCSRMYCTGMRANPPSGQKLMGTQGCSHCLTLGSFLCCFSWENQAGPREAAASKGSQTFHLLCRAATSLPAQAQPPP